MVNLFTDHHRHLDDDGVLVVRMTADSKTMSLVAVVEQRLLLLMMLSLDVGVVDGDSGLRLSKHRRHYCYRRGDNANRVLLLSLHPKLEYYYYYYYFLQQRKQIVCYYCCCVVVALDAARVAVVVVAAPLALVVDGSNAGVVTFQSQPAVYRV